MESAGYAVWRCPTDLGESNLKQPLVSVVTPFHNTETYLKQCIESVLAQSYTNFEYILVDNCSTDGSVEIAEKFAVLDARIRIVRRENLLSQVQNYNGALAEISGVSEYCKIVQADDWIFPDCLKLMVEVFERSESIGLVGAYDLKGNAVRGSTFPYRPSPISGKETAKLYLREGIFPFGSPTTVMYRSSVVRETQPFYDESRLHEDTEKCMQILEKWDFGFVYQVLSFLRVGNESITSAAKSFYPDKVDRYIIVQRYAPNFLDTDEAETLRNRTKREYYEFLSQNALRFLEASFWKYQRDGLSTLGEKLEWQLLSFQIAKDLLWSILNPAATIQQVLRIAMRKPIGRVAESSSALADVTGDVKTQSTTESLLGDAKRDLSERS